MISTTLRSESKASVFEERYQSMVAGNVDSFEEGGMATTPGCKKNQVRTASEDSNEDAPRPVTNPQNLLEDQSESSGAHKLYRELVRECPLVSAASADRIVNTPLVNSSEIEQEWLLGSGSFCQVHRVRIPQLMDHSCCLKSLRPNFDQSLRTDAQVDLWYEGYLLEKLPAHPNLICLVGKRSELPSLDT